MFTSTTSTFGSNGRVRLLLCAALLPLLWPWSAAGQEAGKTLPRVVAVEWIPLRANSTILEAFAKAQAGLGEPQTPIERMTARGDETELANTLKQLAESKPDILLGFGDHVCQALRKKLPKIALVALLVRRSELLTAESSAAPLAILDSTPAPELVWEVARQLRPALTGLGVLYTQAYEPNVQLAASLAKAKQGAPGIVMEITVAEGYCRTDSDFEQALRGEGKGKSTFDVLFVPDDPNGSRFGDVIYKAADRIGAVAIGTEATVGKGCAAALLPDYEALGQEAARLCAEPDPLHSWPRKQVPIPCKMVVDEQALQRHGIKVPH